MNIKELKEAAEKATPGPWASRRTAFHGQPDHKNYVSVQSETLSICRMTGSQGMQAADVPDAAYIALANPSTILSLIASHDALVEALRGLLDANDNVQNVLCDGPEVPGFDPSALGRAQLAVTVAETVARRALETPANPIEEVVE